MLLLVSSYTTDKHRFRNSARFARLFSTLNFVQRCGILQIRPEPPSEPRNSRNFRPPPPKMIVFDKLTLGSIDLSTHKNTKFRRVHKFHKCFVLLFLWVCVFWSNSTSLDCRLSLSPRALVFWSFTLLVFV